MTTPLDSSADTFVLGLLGASGRMGQSLIQEAESYAPVQKIYAWSRSAYENQAPKLSKARTLEDVFKQSDVVVDYTHPDALPTHLDLAVHYKRPLFIGTTGLSEAQHLLLQKNSTSVPILYAPNASRGFTLLKRLVKEAAQALDLSYDVEITETHHRFKKDSPSGTAYALAHAVQEGRNAPSTIVTERRTNERKPGEIGISSSRGGHIIGQHTINFIGNYETLSLSHTAQSRKVFALGTLEGANWLRFQSPTHLHTFEDVKDSSEKA